MFEMQHEVVCVGTCFRLYHTKLHFWRLSDTTLEKQNTQM